MADPNAQAHKVDVEAAAERSETHEAEAQGAPPVEPQTFRSSVEIDDPDEPASGGMQQGATHTRWESKDKTYGQGAKTLAAQRAQQKRST